MHDPGKYLGITLLSHVLKLLERILGERIMRIVECEMGEEQQGFRRGRSTADGLFTLRQLVEKRLDGQANIALGFIDREKAFDSVPREMDMATFRWMGVPEAEVRMVEQETGTGNRKYLFVPKQQNRVFNTKTIQYITYMST